jgi:hypothetical protein
VGLADDAPNSNYEEKMSKSFRSRAGHTDPADWAMVTSQLGEKTYTTHKGETLRDVSTMMFGDPSYWSKIWALNKNITDPFKLPEGTVITFRDGTIEAPPSLAVAMGKDLDRPAPDVSPYALGNTLNAEIPPNVHQRVSTMESIPSSLPSWDFGQPASKQMKLDLDRPIRSIPVAVKNLEYYASEQETPSEAQIEGTELKLKSASEFQYVYVRFQNAPTQKKYIVVKDLGEVSSDDSDQKAPIMTQILGKVDVLEPIDSKNKLYRAIVTKSFANVEVGAKLIAGDLPTYTVTADQGLSKAQAKIIGGRFHLRRKMFGLEGILFLNQGTGAGIAVGQLLPVYQYQRDRDDDLTIKENPRVIGKIKVVKTSAHFSTAVVVSSSTEIEVGDGTSPDMGKR